MRGKPLCRFTIAKVEEAEEKKNGNSLKMKTKSTQQKKNKGK